MGENNLYFSEEVSEEKIRKKFKLSKQGELSTTIPIDEILMNNPNNLHKLVIIW